MVAGRSPILVDGLEHSDGVASQSLDSTTRPGHSSVCDKVISRCSEVFNFEVVAD